MWAYGVIVIVGLVVMWVLNYVADMWYEDDGW